MQARTNESTLYLEQLHQVYKDFEALSNENTYLKE